MATETAGRQPPPEGTAPAQRDFTWVLVRIIAIPGSLALLIWFGLLMMDTWERKKVCRDFSACLPTTDDDDGNLYVDCRHWFTWHYAVLDIGDVRIAVRATRVLPAPTGCSGSGPLCVKSSAGSRLHVSGGTGQSGNPLTTWYVSSSTQNGTTTCQVGETCPPETKFTITDLVISFANREIKIGEGPRVIFLRKDGTVESVEAAKR